MVTWPKNRGKEELFSDLRDQQRLRLVCGVGGCRKSWTGKFAVVRASRDAHRAERHPEFVPPPRRQTRGIGAQRRSLEERGDGRYVDVGPATA